MADKKKKYKIINGKKVEDHSGLGLKKIGRILNKGLKIITRTDGFDTYSKTDLENIRKNKKNNTGNPLNKLNPASDANKRIRDKQRVIKSDSSTKKEKQTAKVQRSALIRKRDNVKISDVKANQKKKVQDNARKRNEKFKKTGKSTVEQRRADAKKKIQDAARKRNEDFQKKKLKIKEKKKKKKNIQEVINKTKKYNDDKYNFYTM